MDRSSLLPIAVLISAFVVPTRARACLPIGWTEHILDPSMQASDQTPPDFPAIAPPTVLRDVGSNDGCGTNCGPDVASIWIDVRATDDMTPFSRIGYRVTLAGGILPAGLDLPAYAIEPTVVLWTGEDSNDDAFDFTLQVVAIDLAGNESAPQTVRVQRDAPGLCAVARGGVSPSGRAALVVAALLLAVRRRRRPIPVARGVP